MATLVTLNCKLCDIQFESPKWNKDRKFCSKICLNRHNALNKRYCSKTYFNECKKKFNNKFSYDKADLDNRDNNKIIVTCTKHGDFKINPGSHLNGKTGGCRKCINENQTKTTHKFITEAIEIHGNNYNYDKTIYINNATNVEIICKKHGSFWQLPYQHVNLKSGCPDCLKIIRISIKEKKWLDSIQVPDDDDHRQVSLIIDNKKYIVDGFYDNVIYEFLGDYWHGNPNIFKSADYNRRTKKTFGDLFIEWENRLKIFKNNGYNVIYKWESEL